ncbi:hypothetical protein VTO42DRAFT_3048 [Malbranchea cinnamomea]
MATNVRFYTSSTTRYASPHHPQPVDDLLSKYPPMSTSEHPAASTADCYTQSPSLRKRIVDRLRLEYYRYEVTYGLYVMTPGEKFVANTFVLVFLSLLIWALFLYFPSLLYQKIRRLSWILTGKDAMETLANVSLGLSTFGGRSLSWTEASPRST